MFSLAYYGLFRTGELTTGTHPIRARNVHVGENKNKILIVLYSSKTHGKESRPQQVKVSIREATGNKKNFFCPFKLMRQYLTTRGNYIDDNESLFVFSDRTPVMPEHMRTTLRELLVILNLNPNLYNCTSFRIGRASDLEKFGWSVPAIKRAGRWRSNAVYKYLRP